MKKYNIINNSLGWFCFLVAAVSYLLTLEPTASFWDCPEFITQGFKLEVGHPPGNPIFMLTARFFANFAFGDVTKVAFMVNMMSGLLSAATILLLFWTITHLVRKLIVADDATEISPVKMLVIFGAGICGALMYAWSDTFWFSAVEGEVYAFSSFCTALVFWLILKWENRADSPHSDKYIVLIAYVIGISIAVHLLNLLCIPAIVLVYYFKKCRQSSLKGALAALCISFVIVGLILYGLVPGFVEIAQYFELFFVNVCSLPYNMGVLIYTALFVASMIWTIYNLYRQKSVMLIRISFILSMVLSGVLFIGDSLIIPVILAIGLCVYMFVTKRLPVRVLTLTALSVLVIFIGYSSYALLLIRSSAHTPMNQNAPDNVFALSSYLNREQYGERPLLYGETMEAVSVQELVIAENADGERTLMVRPVLEEADKEVYKAVKDSSGSIADRYVTVRPEAKRRARVTPMLNGLFPRMYSSDKKREYCQWIGTNYDTWKAQTLIDNPVTDTVYTFSDALYSDPIMRDYMRNGLQRTATFPKPTFADHFKYFMNYQFNHMYWRYFMWNFAGRQNDVQGNGEANRGNWISGISPIDKWRLGDQSLLPAELGKDNPGHNVFYMLPLILGLIGLLWQSFASKRGIEQFWVVFFLFFMTGIAIVIYLNQTPGQPRERDYAFAGSFYAYAIWVGIGVAGLWRMFLKLFANRHSYGDLEYEPDRKSSCYKAWMNAAVVSTVIGVAVPLQVVSQTWDDHDRSGRYTARDYGMNYLNSLDENAIIFTNGDNDTFPLWYAQEVEGVRTDVKVVNLSYLSTDWYIDQLRRQSYDAPGIDFQTRPEDYAYSRIVAAYVIDPSDEPVDARDALRSAFSPDSYNEVYGLPEMKYVNWYIPTDSAALARAGHFTSDEISQAEDMISPEEGRKMSAYGINTLMSMDIISQSAANGWSRPVYFAMTVPDNYYLGLSPYMRTTGLAYEVTPIRYGNSLGPKGIDVDRMYENVTKRFRWGGLDEVESPSDLYLDETVRQMVNTHRLALLNLAEGLYNKGVDILNTLEATAETDSVKADELTLQADGYFTKSHEVLRLILEKLPVNLAPYQLFYAEDLASLFSAVGKMLDNKEDMDTAKELYEAEIDRQAGYVLYMQSLNRDQYMTLDVRDRNIDGYVFLNLIQTYGDFLGEYYTFMKDADPAGAMDKQIGVVLDSLDAKKVDMNRQYAIYEKQMKLDGSK